MVEVCFCGWLDDLSSMPPLAKSALLQEARECQVLRELVGGVAA